MNEQNIFGRRLFFFSWCGTNSDRSDAEAFSVRDARKRPET